jgi:hypothetical protein
LACPHRQPRRHRRAIWAHPPTWDLRRTFSPSSASPGRGDGGCRSAGNTGGVSGWAAQLRPSPFHLAITALPASSAPCPHGKRPNTRQRV